ncbi:MAG: hypothetical protein QUU85_18350, partial [Candidatus Eisenbacteria bacterium]|nr:hypothetical protein [Candidatus Eisenbacteria bacterium]
VPLPEVGEEHEDPPVWRITEDVIEGSLTVTTHEAGMSILPDGRTSLFISEDLEMTAYERDPGRALFRNECVYRLSGGAAAAEVGGEIEIVGSGTSRATPTAIEMEVHLSVRLPDTPSFFERSWSESIPRDLA